MSTNRYIDKLKARLAKEAGQRMQLQAILDDQVSRSRALLAERDAAQKDAERMAFIEEHPNWLRKHKKHWQCVNPFTNYEYPVFKTAREAVDAALQGAQP